MKLMKLIPDQTSIPFTKYRWHALVLTAVSFVGAVIALVTPGLNLGVDFRGGITIEVEDAQPVNLGDVRSAIGALNLGGYKVQEFGAPNIIIVIVDPSNIVAGKAEDGVEGSDADNALQAASVRVQDALRQTLGDDIKFRDRSVVGPTVSGELVQRGVWAVIAATLGMLLYIWVRFQWQWGVGAVIGVIHDSIITVGIFALLQYEFNLATIAAILTVIGYSVNDTVVVYDRIRENLRKYKKMPLAELIDLSLNETLTRTIVTGGTTVLTLLALVFFGGEVLRGFAVMITLGILIGTYSSLFVASPFLLLTGVRRESSGAEQAAAQTP
ncbi:MAG: protein translocase subunit SecF [Pseudomonadota bacterium]|nr:protein translocase subunit SecF [Pseudomonadota bacterium]